MDYLIRALTTTVLVTVVAFFFFRFVAKRAEQTIPLWKLVLFGLIVGLASGLASSFTAYVLDNTFF